ncbi:hypothetical protein F4680DRAFT_465847 [Xylaria scruposa]|nr:hypothetical protein F4680DRAFT_465847 [Xylaria scruposa]
MNTFRGRQRANSAASQFSFDTQGSEDVFQDAQENWDTNSEPPLLPHSNFQTTQGNLEASSHNTDSHVLNAHDIQKSLPVEGQLTMKSGSGFAYCVSYPDAPVINQKGKPQHYVPIPVEATDRDILNQGAENQGSRLLAAPKPSLTSSSRPFTQDYLVSRVRDLLGSNNPSEELPQQFRERTAHACEACEERLREVWFCNICAIKFCGQCWDAQVVHRKLRKGILHEKTCPDIAAKVHNVLSPPTDELVRDDLYRADASTAWFGVERPDDSSPPIFQDYGRFAELMKATDPMRKSPNFVEEMSRVGRDRRTPSLVSFVGQTGAGKSTLIKLLIDFATTGNESFSSPVIGPRGAHVPTSEDVHLYLDPKTADSEGPMLYSDCEGLEGGEREPLGAMLKRMRRQDHTKDADIEAGLLKTKVISERELNWADGPRARSREFAVTNLYPRVLYTFSDVIVFVLRNPRVIEHVFERLVQWAAAAIETSSNQPVLPHAIIALNASEHDLDDSRWDVGDSTESILYDLGQTVNHNVTFKKWAQFWRERGKPINSLVDLILCYYSSVQIIRLPGEGRPKLMEEQVGKLYDGTLTACISARFARYRARMLLDVEDLNDYLQEAFNHYANTLESPFDFVQASSRNSPIPPDFGGNILKLALEMMAILKPGQHTDARRIFSELSYMVASCIMLDSARHNNKGSASQILPKYINHLDDALENFCDQHWPCEFINSKTGVRCVNVRSGHTSKGHQSADGRVFAAGNWVSKFSFEDHQSFRDWVYCCLLDLLGELTTQVQENGEAEEQVASRIHQSMVLSKLFSHAKHTDETAQTRNYLINNTACFCCLFGQAEHCLPCGHILCADCVNTYGSPRAANWTELIECPFLCHENRWTTTCIIHTKPKFAGIRLITLDGGGIRGIVELEVLRQIELELGGLPIQCFIDLIVGTRSELPHDVTLKPTNHAISTGGIIALGLASMNWTVDKCIEQFENLCDQAFTRRTGSMIPLVSHLIEHHHHSKYQTKTLESALKEAFTDDIHLFGGERLPESAHWQVKVAVTATALAGNKTYVLSNYNGYRENQKSSYYHFQRPQLYSTELKIWEAARATSAAPRYFKSFHHESSQKTYIDGAVLHNNPVRIADSERKIIWPDNQVPDLFLSIGTGSSPTLSRAGSEKMKAVRKGILSHGRYLYGILQSTLEQTLNCEKAWDDYVRGVDTSLSSSFSASRFIRINPDVNEIPALDDKTKIPSLRAKAREALKLDPRIPEIGKQLIASTFYFERLTMSDIQPGGALQIQGKIRCRLFQFSTLMCHFGEHLRYLNAKHEGLKFVILDNTDPKPLALVPLTDDAINGLIRNQGFEISRVKFTVKNRFLPTQIYLHFGQVSKYHISGFPRCFAQDGQVTSPRSMAQNWPSCRYTRGSRRRRAASSSWKPPDIRTAPRFDLRHFSSHPDRIIGHDIIASENKVCGSADQPIDMWQEDQTSSPIAKQITKPREQQARTSREAFRALLVPSWMHKSESEVTELGPTRFVRTWLNRNFPSNQATVPDQDFSSDQEFAFSRPFPNIPTKELLRTLQHYNVSPEEFGVYKRWISLLQPSLGKPGAYWLPPPITDTSTSERPPEPSEIWWPPPITDTSTSERPPEPSEIFELADTQVPAELDGEGLPYIPYVEELTRYTRPHSPLSPSQPPGQA